MIMDVMISCIVFVYNEVLCIVVVLKVVVGYLLINEVIVIDDGFIDGIVDVVVEIEGVMLIW